MFLSLRSNLFLLDSKRRVVYILTSLLASEKNLTRVVPNLLYRVISL